MRTALLLLSSLSVVALVGACSAPADVGESTASSESPLAAATTLPLEPPAPAVTQKIDIAFIQLKLRDALGGTHVQLSTWDNDGGQPRVRYSSRVCAADPTYQQCKAECGDKTGLDAVQACRDACETLACVSHVCVNRQTSSFIHFGDALTDPTRPADTDPANCTTTTCPACTVPSRIPTLRDTHIPIPPYDAPLGDCRLKQLSFSIPTGHGATNQFSASSSSTGIHIALNGHAETPTVICNNFPNIQLGPSIRIDLVPSTSNGKLVVELGGAFTGSITAAHAINALTVAAVRGLMRDAIDKRLTDKLNDVAGDLIGDTFDRGIRDFLNLQASARFVGVGTDDDGMWVKYYP